MIRSSRLFSSALVAVALLALFVGFASPSFAAEKRPTGFTLTEEQANKAYAAAGPRSPEVSNRSVDFKPGQVVLSETWKPSRKDAKESKAVRLTLQPVVANNRVEWKFVSATINGQPASAELQKQIQSRVASSWVNFVRGKLGAGRVATVAITENDLAITFTTAK